MLSPEDLAKLDEIYMRSETAKEVFVRKDDCNERHADAATELAELKITLTKLTSQMSMLIKGVYATLGTAGGAIVMAIMNLILKQ